MNAFFRFLLFPVTLPASVIYALLVFAHQSFPRKKYKPSSQVISIGNILVGGTGKTPLCLEISKAFIEKGLQPVVISKSYKAKATKPVEVSEASSFEEVGDEALLLKKSLPDLRVFSGPQKKEALIFAEDQLKELKNKVYLLDDGAQHYKIKKDYKIHIWDLSRSLLDLMPLPFGLGRGLWFLSEKPDFIFFNRKGSKALKTVITKTNKVKFQDLSYTVKSLENAATQKSLSSSDDFCLISGVGNFSQLKDSVLTYTKDHNLDCSMKKAIEAKDHDDFSWFEPVHGVNYLCTEKDLEKLKHKISKEHLYLVKSDFSRENKNAIRALVEDILDQRGTTDGF